VVALVVAAVRLRVASKRGLEWDIEEAIGGYCAIVPAIVGTNNICYNIEEVERLTEAASPLRMFGKNHVACLMHDFAVAQLCMGQSREHEALAILERLAGKLQEPKVIRVIGESSRHRALLGGVLFSEGILHAYEVGTKALETARQLEEVTMNVYAMAADQVRLLHHALRGETDEVQRYRDRVEFHAIQGNATWQAENFWPVLLLAAETLCGDTIAVRRISEQLDRRSKELPSMAIYAKAARAAYLSLRGDLPAAIALYEEVLPNIGIRRRVAWQSVRASYADALSRAGQHARAKEVLEQALSTMLPGEDRIVSRFLEPQRQLAIAEAGLGNHERATEMLDGLLARWGDADQPLMVGLLHKSRAELALSTSDWATFELHHAAMGRCFKSTRNPSLVAQWERLREHGARSGTWAHGGPSEASGKADPAEAEVTTFHHDVDALGTRRLSQLSATPDPYDLALAMIMDQ
jgi:tetratricopeptide (TPR) repeat protein